MLNFSSIKKKISSPGYAVTVGLLGSLNLGIINYTQSEVYIDFKKIDNSSLSNPTGWNLFLTYYKFE